MFSTKKSQKESPKIVWSGDFLDGKLEVVFLAKTGTVAQFKFQVVSKDYMFSGDTLANLAEFKTQKLFVDTLLTLIENQYLSFILDEKQKLLQNGECKLH